MSVEINGKIYLITNKINGKQYVGQTINTIKNRFNGHCNDKTSAIYYAVKKYGKDSFYIDQIDSASTRKELDIKELYWINKLDSFKSGYNRADCNGIGYKRSFKKQEYPKVKVLKKYFPKVIIKKKEVENLIDKAFQKKLFRANYKRGKLKGEYIFHSYVKNIPTPKYPFTVNEDYIVSEIIGRSISFTQSFMCKNKETFLCNVYNKYFLTKNLKENMFLKLRNEIQNELSKFKTWELNKIMDLKVLQAL